MPETGAYILHAEDYGADYFLELKAHDGTVLIVVSAPMGPPTPPDQFHIWRGGSSDDSSESTPDHTVVAGSDVEASWRLAVRAGYAMAVAEWAKIS